ncbi:hypothetical protein BJX68DRAFT_248575 [Aspergillus pseudodeflectus]|uniref:WD40 repeat-like protein n=1 Tax=Aspergillus pseudodeflectus TaxID=176178 RepID=A0ABR4JFD8_9EURO
MIPQHPASKTTTYLDQPPSCLQFCPASPNNFVIGTYLLSSETKPNQSPNTTEEDESSDNEQTETICQTKIGSLQLWNLDPETDALTQLSRYPLPHAVFDLHFHPRIPNLLGIATSAGTVSLFTVNVSDSDSDGKDTGFTHLATYSVHEDPSIPTLFLAWLPKSWLPGFGRDGFAVTFSDGRTGVFGVDSGALVQRGTAGNENDEVTELASFNATQPIEIWFVAAATFPYQNQDTEDKTSRKSTPYLFTGDDFGMLQTIRFPDTDPAADQESDSELDSLPPPLLNISDRALHHTAGLTSILPLPIPLDHPLTSGSPLLLTGSYDEVLRVYHAAGRGRVVAEEGLGGGVWRLELLDTTTTTAGGETWTFLVLASCMHGGTRVVRVAVSAENGGEDVSAEIEILAEFTEHESMNYASGVWGLDSLDPAVEGGAEIKVVSSSFYDKRVCVWRVKV